MHVLWALLVAAQTSVSRAPLPSPAPDTAHFVSRQDSTVLRVLALNDFHGALEARSWPWSHGRAVGGAAALKPWLDSLARACGCTTIRLDAGDEMQGTLLSNFGFGLPAITAMNAFGIDAAAIGNHEFDWSVDTLRARMAGARYRFLAANISDTTGTARPGWAEPWTLLSRAGLKIAAIGLALKATTTNTTPRNVQGIAVVDFVRLRGTKRQVRARIETPYTDQVRPDAALGDTLRVYQRAIETVRSRPVARVKVELRRTGQEYGLGRLIADAQRNVAQADVAIVNNGGIRADLAAGAVTYGDLYEVQPFQNRLVRLLATGKVLKEALEHVVAGDRADAHVSGLEVWYDPGKRAGQRVTKLTLADGRGADGGRTYTGAVSEFLAAGV